MAKDFRRRPIPPDVFRKQALQGARLRATRELKFSAVGKFVRHARVSGGTYLSQEAGTWPIRDDLLTFYASKLEQGAPWIEWIQQGKVTSEFDVLEQRAQVIFAELLAKDTEEDPPPPPGGGPRRGASALGAPAAPTKISAVAGR